MVESINPGVLFILSGACVLVHGVFGVCLYTNSSDHVDEKHTDLMIQGKIICTLGAVQLLFGCLTLIRDIANNRTMSFNAFLLWNTLIALNLLRYHYLANAYEEGWSWRFVMSTISTIPWLLTVGKQYMVHRELINPRE